MVGWRLIILDFNNNHDNNIIIIIIIKEKTIRINLRSTIPESRTNQGRSKY